jgi:hypothetical protein
MSGVNGLTVVPAEGPLLDTAPRLELRVAPDPGAEAPVAYLAPRRGAEIADVILAVAGLASTPLRRRRKH